MARQERHDGTHGGLVRGNAIAHVWLRRSSAIILSMTLVLLLVNACSSSADSSDDETLTVAWPNVPDNLDRNLFQGVHTQALHINLGATLVRWDPSMEDPDTVMTPKDIELYAAKSIEPNANHTRYRITLREGVRSSAGNVMTTKDVKFTFDRLFHDKDTLATSVMMPVANVNAEKPITIIDDRTFTWNLDEPSALSLAVLQWYEFGIEDSTEILRHATPEDPFGEEWMKTHYVGFGPYSVADFEPGREVRLEKNQNYFGPEPTIDSIIIRAVPEASTRVQLLISNEVDFITDIPFDLLETIEESPGTRIYSKPDTNIQGLTFNHAYDPFSHLAVRKAINYAIDRREIVEGVYRGYAAPYVTALPTTLPHEDAPAGMRARYDPELARELLEQAGYADGFEFTLTINSTRPGPFAEDMARLIRDDLKAVGIDVNIQVMASYADFESAVADGKLQAWLYSARPAYPDEGYAFWHTRSSEAGGLYIGNYKNEELDQVIDQILTTLSGAKRDELVRRASILERQDMPWAMLVQVPDIKASRSDVAGYVGYPHGVVLFTNLKEG